MTTIYVSKSGNNANDGLTLTNAKRTMFDAGQNAGAYEIAVDGDTILFDDGVYQGAEIETSAALGYILTNRGLTLDSVNPFSATLNPSTVTACVRVSGPFTNMSLIFGKINLCDNTGTNPNHAIFFTPTTGPATLDLGAVNVMQSIFFAVNDTATNTVQRNIFGNGPKLSASRDGLQARTLGNNSVVKLINPTVNVPSKLVASAAIWIHATGAGCSCEIINPVLNINHASSFPASGDYGIRVMNINNARIINPTVNCTSESAQGVFFGANIDCDSATLTAHNGRVIGGDITIDANGGIIALIGHDGPSSFDNRANNGVLKNIKGRGGAKFVAGGGHGCMLGGTTGSWSICNDLYNVTIGELQKNCTSCFTVGSKIAKTNGSGIYQKGNVSNCVMAFNDLYCDEMTGTGCIIAGNEAAQANVSCQMVGNILHVSNAATIPLVNILGNQGVTFLNTNFNVLTGATLPTNMAMVNSVNYTSINAFSTANDVSAINTDSSDIDSAFSLFAGSGLFLEIAPGINIQI